MCVFWWIKNRFLVKIQNNQERPLLAQSKGRKETHYGNYKLQADNFLSPKLCRQKQTEESLCSSVILKRGFGYT